MNDYSTYTIEDFNNLDNYDLYGFLSDIDISQDEFDNRLKAAFERSEALSYSEIYQFNAEPLFKKRKFIERWTMADTAQLLSNDTFHKFMELDPLERPQVETMLRGQAAKFKCKTEFNKKLKAVERVVISSNIALIKPPNYPFITVEGINMKTGEPKYSVNCSLLADYTLKHFPHRFVREKATDIPIRYLYDDKSGVYRHMSNSDIKGCMDNLIRDFRPSMVNSRYSKEAFTLIENCGNYCKGTEANSDENIINFQNGILHLDTLELSAHTPDIFTTNQIPCNWLPDPPPAPVFDRFMNDFTDGNKEVENFLYAYMGLIISNVNYSHFKKALFMIGLPNTGKSQLLKLVAMLLGDENCASMDLKALEEERFSLSVIYGNRLAYCADMSPAGVTDLSRFKRITGGDDLTIEFKGQGAFTGHFNGFMWFCANDMPNLGKDGQDRKAIYERIIILPCNRVVPPEKQDKQLIDKLYQERETIVYRAVMAAKKVIEKNYTLPIPNTALTSLEQYKGRNSTVMRFLDECCCEREERTQGSNKAQIYRVYAAWCKDNGHIHPVNAENFKKELSTISEIPEDELIKVVHGIRYFKNIQLTSEARNMYRESYGTDSVC